MSPSPADLPNGLLPAIFERMHEGVVITDNRLDEPGPSIVYANPAFSRITGYPRAEIVGRSPRALQGPRSDRAVLDRLRRQLEAGEPFEGETINYRRDGSAFVMQWYIEPLRDGDGLITHFVAIQRDVTQERQRSKQQRALEQAVGQLVDFAVLFSSSGDVHYANRSYVRWCGKAPGDILGAKVWDLPGAPRRHDLAWARRILGQGAAWRQEYPSRHHRRGPRTLFVTVSPIVNEEGSREFLAVGRDMTDDGGGTSPR
ncbi:MAG: PAS domain-containing protein [Acidobacteriota bacterium]